MQSCPSCSREFDNEHGMKIHHVEVHNESISGKQFKCTWCGETDRKPPAHLERVEKPFCSPECQHKWRSKNFVGENNPTYNGGVDAECDYCGSDINKAKIQFEDYDKHFCNNDCHAAWRSKNLTGEKHWNYEGGSKRYGPGFTEKVKEEVRREQNRKCDGCGMDGSKHKEKHGKKLHVHHKIKARDYDQDDKAKNDKSNLVALCYGCHWTAEKMAPLYPF